VEDYKFSSGYSSIDNSEELVSGETSPKEKED